MENQDMIIKNLTDTGYEKHICNYLQSEFPSKFKTSKNDLLEILSDALLGTKDTRFGALPPPEHAVVIREVIRESINRDVPIPIVVPFGGIKANLSGSVDVAELSAIKQIVNLSKLVRSHYSPGIRANFRIEDLNATYLYGNSDQKLPVETLVAILGYTQSMKHLIEILASGTGILDKPESAMMVDKEYYATANLYLEPMLEYLNYSDNSVNLLGMGSAFAKLVSMGWKGVIPPDQREFYLQRYPHLYPNEPRSSYLKRLATYLAGSKARYDLNAKGNPAEAIYEGKKFIQINFSQPVPGAPTDMFNNTLYYRTVPMSEARTHMPAWRAKGFLKMDQYGKAVTKLTNFNDRELIDMLTPAIVRLGDEKKYVDVQTDYLVG